MSFARRYAGMQITLSGDSLMRQLFVALVCLLSSAIERTDMKWHFYSWNSEINCPFSNGTHCYGQYGCSYLEGGGKVCLAGFDECALRSYICVFNGGIHFEHPDAFEKFLSSIAPLVFSRRNLTKFVWRETLPQHFATDDGSFKGHTGEHCQPRQWPWKAHFSSLIANKLFADAGIPILFIEKMTMSQWDAHVVHTYRLDWYKSESVERIDCTHFCQPGVPTSWAELLANMLMHDTFAALPPWAHGMSLEADA